MKKFINNLQILAMLALIPAMVIAYLGTQKNTEEETEKTSIVNTKGFNLTETGNIIHLVKSF